MFKIHRVESTLFCHTRSDSTLIEEINRYDIDGDSASPHSFSFLSFQILQYIMEILDKNILYLFISGGRRKTAQENLSIYKNCEFHPMT